MTEARRRSLVVGALLGLAVALLALVAARVLAKDEDRDQVLDVQLSTPGPEQLPVIETQGDVVGERLPDVAFARLDGGELRFAELQGTPLVVNLWATWCAPCVREMPEFERVSQALRDRVVFVGINVNDGEAPARDLARRTGVTYPLVRDPRGTVLSALEVARMPTTFFVGPDGRVMAVHPGSLTADELTAEIDRLFPA